MSTLPLHLIEEIHHALVADLERSGSQREALTRDFLLPRLLELIEKNSATERLPTETKTFLADRILNSVLGLGPLEALLNDPTVTEIMVNGLNSVFIEREGKLLQQEITFINDAEILRIINRIVGAVGRRIDESSPLADARLPDGSRVHAVIPPLSRIGPVVTIRRFPAEALTLEKMVALGTLSPAMAAFLAAGVAAKQNILISGSTGSGKTSTLNALSSNVGEGERLITIEDTAEMRLAHPHLVRLEARPPNIEGVGEVTIRTLLKNALRMRPDRIIIGEIRGGEALDMLQAMNTGHQGSLTTIHANSAEEALLRLETMALMTDITLPLSAIREQVKSAIQLVVHQERLTTGERKIVAISELMPRNEEGGPGYTMNPLFVYNKQRQVFLPTGHIPARLESFENAGVAVTLDWFAP